MDGRVIVIGGGPAGLMASIAASSRGKEVLLIDKNEPPGRKLLLTGGGRCNITNLCEVDDFLENVYKNREFLFSALYSLSPEMLLERFRQWQLDIKVEDGGRAFPRSDKASDVLDTLLHQARSRGVNFAKGKVISILVDKGSVKGVALQDGKEIDAVSVILSTGGITYPDTGSDGEGLRIAGSIGHNIISPEPRLRSMIISGNALQGLQGITLDDIVLRTGEGVTARGPLLITHDGITGPAVFELDLLNQTGFPLEVSIDLIPSKRAEELDSFLIKAQASDPKKKLKNIISPLINRRLAERMLALTGIPPDPNANQLKKEMRRALISSLKDMKMISTGAKDSTAMITAGGIDIDQVDPSTMGSRIVKGLHFAGEVLDVHAGTGGFNLQIAFSTGNLAGENC